VGDRFLLDCRDPSSLKSLHEDNDAQPFIQAPSVEEFSKTFVELGAQYREIVAILISSHLSQAFANAQQATEGLKSPATIHVIDSQTTAAGLGLLAQAAAEAAVRGTTGTEITRLVRGLARHIYSVFCLPDLSYLERSGQVDPAQAFVGEMLGVIPLYAMESGRLAHIQKIRSSRHLVDILFEFAAEFEELKYLALIQGLPSFEQEGRNLRERIMQNLRSTPIGEHALSLALSTIIGPRAIGLIAMENKPRD
jgi:DegV family protein with EDD domain